MLSFIETEILRNLWLLRNTLLHSITQPLSKFFCTHVFIFTYFEVRSLKRKRKVDSSEDSDHVSDSEVSESEVEV